MTKNLYHFFDNKITFVNSKHALMNSKGDFVPKKHFKLTFNIHSEFN